MNKLLIFPLVLLLGCGQSGSVEIPLPEIEANADIFSLEQIGDNEFSSTTQSIGTAKFSQAGNVVTLTVSLHGLTPNTIKSMHIHNGSLDEPGKHWNQQSFYAFCDTRSIGQAWGKPFAGDIGNIQIDAAGNGQLVIQTDLWALNSGDEKDILDKVVIVHEDAEDFTEECNPFHTHDYLHVNVKIAGGTIDLLSNIEQKSQTVMTSFPDFTICK